MSNKFNKLTIDGITYTAVDPTKLEKPAVDGVSGQVLTYTNNGPVWDTAGVKDYTAFEVFAHTQDITAGVYDALGDKVSTKVSAGTTHVMFIRSTVPPADQDVVIDWGDNTVTNLCDGVNSTDCYFVSDPANNPSEYLYYLKHDYAPDLSKNSITFKRYKVKITGKNYFGVKYTNTSSDGVVDKETNESVVINTVSKVNNLICRVFESDLPIASHITNLSSFCYAAKRLLNVNVELKHPCFNLANVFRSCTNLLTATGMYRLTTIDTTINNIFTSCQFLKETDLEIPPATLTIAGAFSGCISLDIDITSLLPSSIFTSSSMDVSTAFQNCRKLQNGASELLGQYFWNNKEVSWSGINTAFKDSSQDPDIIATNQLIEHIPVSWGGTASDAIISPSIAEQLDSVDKRLTVLEESEPPSYTEGTGISIKNSSISIDTTVVAQKTDLFSKDYNDLTNKPINISTFTNDKGYMTEAAVSGAINEAALLDGNGITITRNKAIEVNVDNNTIIIDSDVLKVNTTQIVAKSEYDQKMLELADTLGDISSSLTALNATASEINGEE